MTGLHGFLEDFAAPKPRSPAADSADETQLESAKLEAFDQGYRAGWDDAIKAQSDNDARIASELAQNLQDLSFTYNEAYRQLIGGVTPLLEELLHTLLPALLRDTLGVHLHEQLSKLAREIGQREVTISVAPGTATQLAPLLEHDFGFPLRLTEDPTLAEGQADMSFGGTEQQIDLSGLLREVTEAVEGFAHDTRRSAAHG